MTQLELTYKTSTIGLYRYLDLSQDWMMRKVFQHESQKKLHSVVKEGRKFANELGMDLEVEFEGEM